MQIAVLGTGAVGRAVGARLAGLGHQVTIGTRDVAATSAATEPDGHGNPPFSAWHGDHPEVRMATFADAAAGAELVVNATGGDATPLGVVDRPVAVVVVVVPVPGVVDGV